MDFYSELLLTFCIPTAMHFIKKLENTKVFGDWELTFNDRVIPECAQHGNWTDMYMECYLRHITLSGYAPVGTCKIGAPGDPTAVVDPLLRSVFSWIYFT